MLHITPIHCGNFYLDGGAMFGVVPRRMWAKLNPPDADNMCRWAMRALLVQSPDGRLILIDTGIGNKQDARFRDHFRPEGPENLFDSLAAEGVSRGDITDVFLTHLHFDHCGGALWRNPDTEAVELSFPNATYWTNEVHYQWALHPNAREKASFLKENFVPLAEAGRLRMIPVEQDYAWLPGWQVRFYYGHTEALMAPLLDTQYGPLLYCADALPSQWHIPMPYVMAYDIRPLVTLNEKEAMLQEAVENNWKLFLEHDPIAEYTTVHKDESGRIIGRACLFSSL
jgi:glyoxylase-like metal-dependent hydrolase (beta-lactamase superfamily II)